MNVREVLDWLRCEEPKTSYAADIRACADQMLRNYSGGGGRTLTCPRPTRLCGRYRSRVVRVGN